MRALYITAAVAAALGAAIVLPTAMLQASSDGTFVSKVVVAWVVCVIVAAVWALRPSGDRAGAREPRS